MSNTHYPEFNDHLIDLAIGEALGQSTAQSRNELDLLDPTKAAQDAYEAAAAATDAACADPDPSDLPEGLMDRMLSSVDQFASIPQDEPSESAQPAPIGSLRGPIPFEEASVTQQSPSTAPRTQWVPWAVAAASLLITATVLFAPKPAPTITDPANDRLALIENTAPEDLIQWDWISTDDSAVVGDVIGDVVWSDSLNKGYMRISGLAVNDPSLEQYQLWIFDATRKTGDLPQFGEGLLTQRPIDGGVFNASSTGEIIIPIDAKITVRQAAAFAVTVEPPGGVVVSDRSRVPLLALAP